MRLIVIEIVQSAVGPFHSSLRWSLYQCRCYVPSEVKQGRSALVALGQNDGILETGVRWWADSSVTRSGPEGSSRNEVFLGCRRLLFGCPEGLIGARRMRKGYGVG